MVSNYNYNCSCNYNYIYNYNYSCSCNYNYIYIYNYNYNCSRRCNYRRFCGDGGTEQIGVFCCEHYTNCGVYRRLTEKYEEE